MLQKYTFYFVNATLLH